MGDAARTISEAQLVRSVIFAQDYDDREEGADLSREFTYDSLGALSKVIVGKRNTNGVMVLTTFTYLNDGLGRRIEKRKNGALQR